MSQVPPLNNIDNNQSETMPLRQPPSWSMLLGRDIEEDELNDSDNKISGRQATLKVLSELEKQNKKSIYRIPLKSLQQKIKIAYNVDISTKSISLYRSQYKSKNTPIVNRVVNTVITPLQDTV